MSLTLAGVSERRGGLEFLLLTDRRNLRAAWLISLLAVKLCLVLAGAAPGGAVDHLDMAKELENLMLLEEAEMRLDEYRGLVICLLL